MAIVPDLSGNSPASALDGGVDRAYSTFNRVVTATPVGVLTPTYVGEVVFDTSSGTYWRAALSTSDGWSPTVVAS